MLNFLRNILIILSLLTPNYAHSIGSSSYLIANAATNLFDFDAAILEFKQLKEDLSESDLHNRLLTYVSLNLLSEANSIARDIIKINDTNQEAWIVHLAYAKKINDLNIFQKFKKNKNMDKMDLLNYIFFSSDKEIKNSKSIVRSILEIIQASVKEGDDQINYKFLLFYLSIASLIEPKSSEVYFYSAQIYQILKNYSKAESFYKKIPINHRLFIASQKNIAINKNKIGFHNEAIKLLNTLLQENKEDLDLRIAIADLYRIQKNYKDAIKVYSEIINLSNQSYKEYWKIYYLRGICFERIKKWDLAEKDFLYSLNIKPNSPQVLNYLAYGWLERDMNIEKATKMLKEAYRSNPESSHIADSLAWAFFKKNEFLKALDLMEKVINMAPGEAISLDHLGDIYFAMNRKREAFYFWRQALDLAETQDDIINKLKSKLEIANAG